MEWNRRFIAGTALAATLALLPSISQAQTASSNCASGQLPSFVSGFASLAQSIGASMGKAVECEHADPHNGDTLQQTTTGLAFYRKATNTPTFTNGDQHWALTPSGLVSWTGGSIDPPSNASTSVPVPQPMGDLSDPIPMGQPLRWRVTRDGADRNFTFSVLEVKRGDEAMRMLKAANQFNDPPKPGLEYLLVKMQVTYESGPAAVAEPVSKRNFQTTGQDGVLRDYVSEIEPDPRLDTKLFPGGVFEGWGTYEITTGDPFPRIGPSFTGGTPKGWLSLTQTPPVPSVQLVQPTAYASAASKLAELGYQPYAPTASEYDRDTLRVLLGAPTVTADGHGQRAFFFYGDQYLGTDTAQPSATISFAWRDADTIAISYVLYGDRDPLCCPTSGAAVVRFHWNGQELEPLDPIPPTDGNPHR